MKVQTILQAESQECGLACLAMIASAHGHNVGLPELRRRLFTSIRGATLSTLISQAQEIGFTARAIRLELEEIEKLQTPCILHWNLNHYVVLEGVSKSRLLIHDPARGFYRITLAEASGHFTGVALELAPGADFRIKKKPPSIRLSSLTGKLFGFKRALLNIILLALAIEVVGLITPQVTQWVVDGALVSSDRDLLLVSVIGGGILIAAEFVLRMARGWMALRLNQQLSVQWATNLFQHLVKLPWQFFEKRSLGDISARFESLDAIRKVLADGAVTGILDGIVSVATLGMMFLYSLQLGLISVVAALLYGLLRWVFYRPLRNASEERIVLSARENSFFLESVRAILPIKQYGMTHLRVATWKNLIADVQNRDVRTQRLMLIFSSVNTLIFGLESMLLLYVGGGAVLDQELSLGMLLAFIAYKTQFISRTGKLIDLIVEVRMLAMHAERIADIALEPPESSRSTSLEEKIGSKAVKIEFKNVSFRYSDNEPWVLRNLSLVIDEGESVAIVGRSGSGKSTILKLLMGMLAPTEGDVFFGGVSISHLGVDYLRRTIGVIMQEDHLLAGSLAQNISCFDPEIDREKMKDSAVKARIHNTIATMPMAYETMISELGGSLSGGQRQRVLLARLLYREPKIIALDEATSHLDLMSEQHIIQALKGVRMTKIIIAHRPETVALVDRIIRIDQGGVVEDIRVAGTDMISSRKA